MDECKPLVDGGPGLGLDSLLPICTGAAKLLLPVGQCRLKPVEILDESAQIQRLKVKHDEVLSNSTCAATAWTRCSPYAPGQRSTSSQVGGDGMFLWNCL